MNDNKEARLKKLLVKFFDAKGVVPPITRNKIIRAGHEPTMFFLELKGALKPYSDLPLIQDYLKACEDLI